MFREGVETQTDYLQGSMFVFCSTLRIKVFSLNNQQTHFEVQKYFHSIFLFQFLQCAKLSMDTENPILYPLKYVCLSDILSKFGEQVYERLKIKEEIFMFVY